MVIGAVSTITSYRIWNASLPRVRGAAGATDSRPSVGGNLKSGIRGEIGEGCMMSESKLENIWTGL